MDTRQKSKRQRRLLSIFHPQNLRSLNNFLLWKILKNSTQKYREDIDGLRAVAVLSVLAYHIDKTNFPLGYLGVDIFFVISGYVVTKSILQNSAESPVELLLSFYSNRVRRIFPALLACVLATVYVSFLLVPNFGQSLWTGMSSLIGASNLYLFLSQAQYGALDSDMNLFTQTWSLGVEEQFYLVIPLLFALTAHKKIRSGKKLLTYVVFVFTAGSFICYSVLRSTNPNAAFYLVIPRFWELSVGVLLALLGTTATGTQRQISGFNAMSLQTAISSLVSLAIMLVAIWPIRTPFPNFLAVSVTGLFLVIPGNRLKAAVLESAVSVFLGKMSYSLYLWHWPIIVWFHWTYGVNGSTIPIILGLILSLSLFSYFCVERPIRFAMPQIPDRWILITGIFGALLGIVLLGLTGLYNTRISELLYIGDKRFIIGSQYNDKQIELPNCSFSAQPGNNCFHQISPASGDLHREAQGRIIFVGDSHARQLMYPIAKLADRGAIYGYMKYTPEDIIRPADLSALARNVSTDTTIVFSIVPDHIQGLGENESRKDRIQNLRNFALQLKSIANAKGARILFVNPLPRICSRYKFGAEGIFPSTCVADRPTALATGTAISKIYREVVRPDEIFEIENLMCPDDHKDCTLFDNQGKLLYFDYVSHLTKYAQDKIAQPLKDATNATRNPQ